MRLKEGFQIDVPSVFIPWGISETELNSLLGKYGLQRVVRGYYTISCETLGGLKHELGFHFEPKVDGGLCELAFFRTSYANQRDSYAEFQKYFEKNFGTPSSTAPTDTGFPSHEWKMKYVTIVHYVMDRFGPEEHARIRRTGSRKK